jgi:hypothetical protein
VDRLLPGIASSLSKKQSHSEKGLASFGVVYNLILPIPISGVDLDGSLRAVPVVPVFSAPPLCTSLPAPNGFIQKLVLG